MVLTEDLFVKMVASNYPISEDAFFEAISNSHLFEDGHMAPYSTSVYLKAQNYSIDFYRKLFPLIKSRISSSNRYTQINAGRIQFPEEILRENENNLSFPNDFVQKALPFDVALRHLTVENSEVFIITRKEEITEQFIRDNIDVLNIDTLLYHLSRNRKFPIDLLMAN